MKILQQELEQELKQVLPKASLKQYKLGEVNLYLIDEEFAIDNLSADEAKIIMDNPLYWLFCWASGRVMAEWVLQGNFSVKDKTVLDFGSGSGVVAIACKLAGAKKVIASDIDPISQKAIALNAMANNVELEIVGDFSGVKETVDIVTVADVLYEKNNIQFLDALMASANTLLLADSRVKNFSYPGLEHFSAVKGDTFPNLGGFDEFDQVNLFKTAG